MADDTRSTLRGLLVTRPTASGWSRDSSTDALHDPLTGLANRVLLRDPPRAALARAGREPGRVALLLVDLDDFKRVNDTFGHAAGDDNPVPRRGAPHRAVGEGDVVGRQSGDEFAILLVNVVAEEEASAAAQRILGELRRPIRGRRLDRHRCRDPPRAGHGGSARRRTSSFEPMPRDVRGRGPRQGHLRLLRPADACARTWTELEASG